MVAANYCSCASGAGCSTLLCSVEAEYAPFVVHIARILLVAIHPEGAFVLLLPLLNSGLQYFHCHCSSELDVASVICEHYM